ncbi:MAG: ATP-binding protein [Gallionella sp.]|nr:ATP-binding protein [Gallionella sp.]
MRRSLQRHLSLVLGSAVLLAGLVATAASFSLAYSEAKEFQDDMLRQIALLSHGESAVASTSQQSDLNNDGITDPESRVTIFHLPGDSVPAWLKRDLPPGLHTLGAGNEQMRVFVHDGHTQTIVVQPTDARDEIAINSALRTLIPLLLLMPVLAWLIVRIVRSELAPITNLSKSLDEQSAHHPHQLQSDDLPQEIIPFVDAINRLLERGNQLMGQQRRFIADAAHELRSPLAALSIQVQNLMNADSLPSMRERVPPLRDGIERARQLTEQLLSLARTQAGSEGESMVNVSAMARELIAEYLPQAEVKHIDLGLDEVAPLSLRAEPDALRLILRNALENAMKYTHEGGEVTLRLLHDHNDTVIEVVDNGSGIPVTERERVFNPFYRIPGTSGDGSGLGLAIAREAANRLGGTVSVHERQERNGLVFRYRQARKS